LKDPAQLLQILAESKSDKFLPLLFQSPAFSKFISMELVSLEGLINKKEEVGSDNMRRFKNKIIRKCGIIGIKLEKNTQCLLSSPYIFATSIGKWQNY